MTINQIDILKGVAYNIKIYAQRLERQMEKIDARDHTHWMHATTAIDTLATIREQAESGITIVRKEQ